MKKVLITGANKSIGFETAKVLLKNGYYVYLGSRSVERGNIAVEKQDMDKITMTLAKAGWFTRHLIKSLRSIKRKARDIYY